MKFKAITADQVVLIDGKPEWCDREGVGFTMPDNEWAVSFDSELGLGEVEYTDYRHNENITVSDYESRYQFLEQHHADAKAVREAREAAEAAEAELVE